MKQNEEKLPRTEVEVHGTEVYQREFTTETIYTPPFRLVGSCTSPEAAQAVARLLSL